MSIPERFITCYYEVRFKTLFFNISNAIDYSVDDCMYTRKTVQKTKTVRMDGVVDNLILDKITNKRTSVLNYSKGNSEHKLRKNISYRSR